MDQLGVEMKEAISHGVIVAKIDSLKPGFWRALGNHALSGIASVAVALALFGVVTLYSSFQQNGGLEGRIRQITTPSESIHIGSPSASDAP